MSKNNIPKKAKLIRADGFSKVFKISRVLQIIHLPRFRFLTGFEPELYPDARTDDFRLVGYTKTMAIYKQFA